MFKKLCLISMLLALSGCIIYGKQEKFERRFNMDEVSNVAEDQKFLASFVNYNYYTKENLIKMFGTPQSIEKENGIEFLRYEYKDRFPITGMIFVVIPFRYKNDDDVYDYTFELKNNKLQTVSYQDLKGKMRGGSLLPPFIYNNDYSVDINPFESNACANEFALVSGTFPNLTSNATITKTCDTHKLLDMRTLRTMATDMTKRDKGYTKVVKSKVFLYNKDIFKMTRADLEKHYRKTIKEADSDRLYDEVTREDVFKTKDLDCRLFMKVGKDPKANNKGKEEYLILDFYGALCYTKYPDMILDVQNSNRYPESMRNDVSTYDEIISILETIKIR